MIDAIEENAEIMESMRREADLRKSERAVIEATGAHLSQTGACDESTGVDSLCTRQACTYCDLARKLQTLDGLKDQL